MVKLFVLNGGSNVGKSTTLNLLIDLFQIISSRYEICFDPEHYEDVNDRWTWFIFEGKKIGICTSGDNYEACNKNLSFFQDNGCDIAVCASHVWSVDAKKYQRKLERKDIPFESIKKNSAVDPKHYVIQLFLLICKELQISIN